ncbi:hypothetical protein GCM10009809_29040 [Isoptericola hypogeus]|uniref:Peptidase S8/S53 domain-containing protein n=1 Tax=Isoptericola hypogeus TaxID=300179 RepID=A0ABP4VQD1_9MICO
MLAAGAPAAAEPAAVATDAQAGTDPAAPSAEPTVERRVTAELEDGGATTFWVYLKEEADLSGAAAIDGRSRQGRVVYQRLTAAAEESQADLVELLDAEGADYETFWIANTVEVTGDAGLLERIVALPEVATVAADRVYELPEPTPTADAPTADAPTAAAGVEWGVDQIGAPRVWEQWGVTGEGIVVGNIDSGVQYDHPALVAQYRGSNGDGTVDHDHNWWDATRSCGILGRTPCDSAGHGTHTMGTMVGDDGENHIGVAPGARWIAAKGCAGRSCTQNALLSSGQWMLAPTEIDGDDPDPALRPHVINNSWGSAAAADDPWFQETVRAWVAAGIFPVFSAGNEGPVCGTDGNPGNMPESYAVGAYAADGTIAEFSSRGPSEFGGLVKPNIAAPGVAVRSSVPGDGYAASDGTSMAAPHVAGTVALMWSAAPAVSRDVVETRLLLDRTAADVDDRTCGGTAGNNNVWGEGRLDAYAAVDRAPRGPAGLVTGVVTDAATGAPVAGATVTVADASGPVGLPRSTDADGRYDVRLPVGDYTVAASALAYVTGTAATSVVQDATTSRDLALAAPAGRGLDVGPASLDFGTVPIGTAGGPMSVTLTSTGSRPVTVAWVSRPGSGFVRSGGTCDHLPFRLGRLESCTLEYSFRPTAEEPVEATFSVLSDGGRPAAVSLRGSGTTVPARIGAVQARSLEENLGSAVIDPAGRYAYFGTDRVSNPLPGYVVKVDLQTFERVGAVSVGVGQRRLQDGVIDPAGRYAYFGVATSPSRVVRIDLETFTLDKILVLGEGEVNVRSAVIDPAGEFAYFGTGTNPGRVVKVDLRTFERVGAVVLGPGAEFLASAVMDPSGEYAYFGTMTYPAGQVVRIDLETFEHAGTVTFEPGERYLRSAVVDPDGEHAYFGTGEGTSGRVVRVDLGSFERDAALNLEAGALFSAVMDPQGDFASFATHGRVVTVDLERFEPVGSVALPDGEDGLVSAVIDPRGEHAYFGTQTAPGRVVKVRVGARFVARAAAHELHGLRWVDLEWEGATSAEVDVVRNGRVVATVPNTGRYTDLGPGYRDSLTYRLCDAGTDRCTDDVVAAFDVPSPDATPAPGEPATRAP